MSIQAILYFEDRPINALQANYSFKQDSDYSGKPCAKTRFMGFNVQIESTKDSDIMEWMINPDLAKQLKLKFVPRIIGTKTRTIDFIDAHCINYVEHFKGDGTTPMTIELHITAAGVKDSTFGTEFQEYWRTTYPNVTPVTKREENKDLVLLSAHYEDEEGNIVDEKYYGKAFLVLKTENGSGKEIDIDLSSKEHDFRYKGEIAKDDILRNVAIAGDITKIELEIIEQLHD